MNRIAKIWLTTCFVFSLILTFSSPALSQAVINQIKITEVNYQQFPEIQITARVLGSENLPSTPVTESDLIVTEAGEPVNFSVQEFNAGINTIIVWDAGAGITAVGATGARRLDEMRSATQRFIGKMGEHDAVGIIVVRPDSVNQIHALSSDKESLLASIAALEYPITSNYSKGGDGIAQAIDILTNATNAGKVPSFILMFSMGIQDTNVSNHRSISDVEDLAKKNLIPVHTIQFHSIPGSPLLERIASNTGGHSYFYSAPTSLDDLYSQLALHCQQQLITYRSKKSSSQRLISVAANMQSIVRPQDTYTLIINPPPQPLLITSLLINNGDPIVRSSLSNDADMTTIPPTEVSIQADFTWPDGYTRRIDWAEVVVDGQVIGSRLDSPPTPLSMVWDIRNYKYVGDTTAQVQVRLRDEIGFETLSTSYPVTVTVSVVIPPPCEDKTGIDYYLCKSKEYLTIVPGLIALLLMIPTFILAFLAYKYRGPISDAAHSLIDYVTDPIRWASSRKSARAYLYLLGGDTGSPRNVFPLFETTKIGGDPRHAGGENGLLLHNSVVSGLHCTILETDEGNFTISDEGSKNGTLVNGQPIGKDEIIIREGDQIELGEVEHGGVLFKFSLHETLEHEEDSGRTKANQVSTDEDGGIRTGRVGG